MDIALLWNSIALTDRILAIVLALLFVYQLYFYIRYIAAPIRQNRRARKQTMPETAEYPGVSVIVSARNEETNLTNYLQALVEQDYPKYEVIVVNDGSEDNTGAVLEEYQLKYANKMHVTFVPVEARITSSKKLALTLAIKAANYECLLLTDADCVPESNHWIREMVKGYMSSPETQIVLGYSPYFPTHDGINRIIRYETLFNGLHYLGRAIGRHPYMGVGRNMMYSRSMFMSNNGFSGLLMMRAGDDDLFVNKVATHRNTVAVCTPDSLCWSLAKTSFKEWIYQKRRHLSVSPHYKSSTRCMLGVEPLTRALWYMVVIASCIWGSIYMTAAAAALCIIRWVVQIAVINAGARSFGEKTFGMEVIWYDICLPVLTAFLLSTQPKNQHTRW
ncbi:MAG: glycosyltransferase [Paludibacteraceae bacterium]|nr:glycosyltransferase [Paludibacteraceae bacterium]